MGREFRLIPPNGASVDHYSMERLRLWNPPDSFPIAGEQKRRRRLQCKRRLIGERAASEGTSSQTPLDNVETVLDVIREAVCEFRAGSDAVSRENSVASGLTPDSGQSSQTLYS